MTLQEYLVKLGFSVDEPAMKKFVGAVSAAGARTTELGSAALETATAVELMVSRVARNYETLYYMSQRTGQSVKYIQSTQFAFKQIGLSAEDANSSIEGIASTLRTQPWLKAIFGGANTPQQVATNLGRSGLPYFLQVKFAEMIGMSEKTLFQMQKFGQVEADAQADLVKRQREAGFNPDDFAQKSAVFGRALNKLESDLEIFGDRMAADLIAPTQWGIEKMDQMVQWLNRLDNATKGWLGVLEAVGGSAAGLLIVEKILRRMLGLSSTTAVGKLLGLATGGRLGMGGGIIGASIGALEMVKENDPETKSMLQKALGPALYEMGLSKSPNLTGDASATGGGGKKISVNANKAERLSRAINFFKDNGFSDASAVGIASGLFSESNLDTNSFNGAGGGQGAIGIGQWRGNRIQKFQELYGKPLKGSSIDEQLQYVLWELQNGEPQSKAAGKQLLAGGLSPRGAAGTFVGGFERPGPSGQASDMRTAGPLADQLASLIPQQNVDSSKSVTLNAKTDINIHGGGDTSKAIKGYSEAHNDVNDSLIYQLQQPFR
jgi:hypothetical protein